MAETCTFESRAGTIVLDGRKAAFMPKSRTLLVGDLHFEKASFLQMNGHAPLPAYDTDDTLARLADVIKAYAPDHVAVLGDSFHDEDAGLRLSAEHFTRINGVVESVAKFTWILGNHDPSIPKGLRGAQEDHLTVDGCLLTHLPVDGHGKAVNICGHLHPKVRFKVRNRRFSLPCFAGAENRLILPSFGTFTGGLYVDHPAIAETLFGKPQYCAVNKGDVYRVKQ